MEFVSIYDHFYTKCSKVVTFGRDSEFYAYYHSDEDADKLIDVNCTNALKSLECEPVGQWELFSEIENLSFCADQTYRQRYF